VTTLAAYLANVSYTAKPKPSLPSCVDYVGASQSEYPRISAWYAAAIAWCDQKLSSRDFVDALLVTADPPDPCIVAVFEWVKAMREIFGRGVGVSRIKTANREEQYSAGLGHGGVGAGGLGGAAAAGAFAWPLLEPYIEEIHGLCSGGVG